MAQFADESVEKPGDGHLEGVHVLFADARGHVRRFDILLDLGELGGGHLDDGAGIRIHPGDEGGATFGLLDLVGEGVARLHARERDERALALRRDPERQRAFHAALRLGRERDVDRSVVVERQGAVASLLEALTELAVEMQILRDTAHEPAEVEHHRGLDGGGLHAGPSADRVDMGGDAALKRNDRSVWIDHLDEGPRFAAGTHVRGETLVHAPAVVRRLRLALEEHGRVELVRADREPRHGREVRPVLDERLSVRDGSLELGADGVHLLLRKAHGGGLRDAGLPGAEDERRGGVRQCLMDDSGQCLGDFRLECIEGHPRLDHAHGALVELRAESGTEELPRRVRIFLDSQLDRKIRPRHLSIELRSLADELVDRRDDRRLRLGARPLRRRRLELGAALGEVDLELLHHLLDGVRLPVEGGVGAEFGDELFGVVDLRAPGRERLERSLRMRLLGLCDELLHRPRRNRTVDFHVLPEVAGCVRRTEQRRKNLVQGLLLGLADQSAAFGQNLLEGVRERAPDDGVLPPQLRRRLVLEVVVVAETHLVRIAIDRELAGLRVEYNPLVEVALAEFARHVDEALRNTV